MGDLNGGGRKQRNARSQWRCLGCPPRWRPWREGGEATALKHAAACHPGQRVHFEYRYAARAQWAATGDGRAVG